MLYRIKAEAMRWILISWRTLDSVANAEIILAHKLDLKEKWDPVSRASPHQPLKISLILPLFRESTGSQVGLHIIAKRNVRIQPASQLKIWSEKPLSFAEQH